MKIIEKERRETDRVNKTLLLQEYDFILFVHQKCYILDDAVFLFVIVAFIGR